MGKLLTKKEKATVQYYDKNAKEWAAEHMTKKFWGPTGFYDLLPSGKIIEIGSGGGRDARDYLIGKYDYIGTDISKSLLEEAKKLNPGVKFLQRSVYDLKFADNTFDGFWASAILLHIPKNRINKALNEIHRVARNNGVGFISIKKGKGEKEDENGRWFSYYSKQEFNNILKSNGYKVIHFNLHPMSKKTIWLVYIVKVIK